MGETDSEENKLEEEKEQSAEIEVLTEEVLKEFDEHYAISQLLHDNAKFGKALLANGGDANNANYAIPEYVNECKMDGDDCDDESLADVLSSNGSISSYNPSVGNTLNSLTPTVSTISSEVDSSPGSEVENIQQILPKIDDKISSDHSPEITAPKPKSSKLKSILN